MRDVYIKLLLIFGLITGSIAPAVSYADSLPPLFHTSDQKFFVRSYKGATKDPLLVQEFSQQNAQVTFTASLPARKEFVSAVYRYDFSGVPFQEVKNPIRVSVVLDDKNDTSAQLYFFDRNKKAWQPLPTKRSGNVANTETRFPVLEVAALRDRPWNTALGIEPDMIPAKAIYVRDGDGTVLMQERAQTMLPLASITKLMTSLVFLGHNPGFSRESVITAADDAPAAKISFEKGEKVTMRDLFSSMLVGSYNNAAKALARASGLSSEAFLAAMNGKAKSLGMGKTIFYDVTGLSADTQGTAQDVAALAQAAFSQKDITAASTQVRYQFSSKVSKKVYTARTTDMLLARGEKGIVGAKTGYTDEAGYNFVVSAKRGNRSVTVVVLGADTSDARFEIARVLLNDALDDGVLKIVTH